MILRVLVNTGDVYVVDTSNKLISGGRFSPGYAFKYNYANLIVGTNGLVVLEDGRTISLGTVVRY